MSDIRVSEISRVTWSGLFVNLLLSGIKFAGGILGASQAVVADAVHSLSDCSTDVAILVGVRYWSQPADQDHPHGHRRIETFVTLLIGASLAALALVLGYRALATLHTNHVSEPGWSAFFAALISIIVKETLYRWTAYKGMRLKSSALVANAWHHRSDAMSSIPAALAVAAVKLNPRWGYLDHIGAIIVALLILQAAWKIARPAIDKLLDRAAPEEVQKQIERIALETSGVKLVHALRTRYIGCSGLAVDLHIKVNANMPVKDGHDISEDVKNRLVKEGPDVLDVIVHLEPYDPAGK